MVRTLVYGMHWKSQSKAIRRLEKKGLIDVAVWIGKNRENDFHIGALRRAQIDKENFKGYNCALYQKIYDEAFVTFLDMFSRTPSMYTVTHQEYTNIYNYYYDFFSTLLYEKKIELLLFYNLPHFGVDYLLTVMAKHMGIKMVLMYQSLIPNRFIYVTDMRDFGVFKNNSVTFPYPSQSIPQKFEKSLFYMKNIELKYRSCNYVFLNRIRRILSNSRGKMKLGGLLQSYKDCLCFKYHYQKFAESEIDKSRKSVYFPLQLQPELTTSTLGGIFVDQLLAIEKISCMIPDDWIIYVKENPKQLEGYRGNYFFKRLQKLDKVRYMKKDVDSYALISQSEFVATITGTAGWEAISGGKCVVTFGQSWYQNFPGVFCYRDDLSLNDILKYKIDHKKLEEAYNNFIQHTADGIVDRGYIVNYPDYSDDENAIFVEKSLEKIIKSLI